MIFNADSCRLFGDIGEDPFSHQRVARAKTGALYLELTKNFPERTLTVTVVDPRNIGPLILKLLADVLHYRPPFVEALRTIFMVFAIPALVANGRVVYSGHIPEAPEAVASLRPHLRSCAPASL